MTSYPVSMPDNYASAISWRLDNAVGVSESPWNFSQQVVAFDGQRWAFDFNVPVMKRADAEAWITFLVSLRGVLGTFLAAPPDALTPRGTATGTPLVKGAGQAGNTLVTDGWTNGVTGILKKGDWLQLGSGSTSHLHKVLADANSDGSGNASFTIEPALREAPTDNSAIVHTPARGLFRLTDSAPGWRVNEAGFYQIAFSAVEALSL